MEWPKWCVIFKIFSLSHFFAGFIFQGILLLEDVPVSVCSYWWVFCIFNFMDNMVFTLLFVWLDSSILYAAASSLFSGCWSVMSAAIRMGYSSKYRTSNQVFWSSVVKPSPLISLWLSFLAVRSFLPDFFISFFSTSWYLLITFGKRETLDCVVVKSQLKMLIKNGYIWSNF